jgi:fatty-acyl-CoA synthase
MSTQPLANLADMVRERATSRGNATAYEFEGRVTSFAAFDIKTNKVANALLAMGVKKGERIAYLGKNSDLYFELLMGAMKAGVVMAPVNWRLAGPEVAFIVGDCKAPVLFVGPEFISSWSARSRTSLPWRAHSHHHRRRRAGMAGFYGLARCAERR